VSAGYCGWGGFRGPGRNKQRACTGSGCWFVAAQMAGRGHSPDLRLAAGGLALVVGRLPWPKAQWTWQFGELVRARVEQLQFGSRHDTPREVPVAGGLPPALSVEAPLWGCSVSSITDAVGWRPRGVCGSIVTAPTC